MIRTKLTPSSGIYQIQSIINDKRYIGSANNIYKRIMIDHKRALIKGIHPNQYLQFHVNKHGIECLQFSIIEFCSRKQLLEREQFYISTLKPEFNICKIVGRPPDITGCIAWNKGLTKEIDSRVRQYSEKMRETKKTEESKQKMRESQKSEKCRGYTLSEETKQKMSLRKGNNNPFYGKYHSEESKRKNREAHLGEKSYMFGKSKSKETKQKLREAHLGEKSFWFGKFQSEETIKKKRKSMIGKNVGKIRSEELKEQWRNSHKGQKAWNKGLSKKQMEEYTQKIKQNQYDS